MVTHLKNIVMDTSPVCELISSLALVQNYGKVDPPNPRHEHFFPTELHKWVETVRKTMSEKNKSSLEIFFHHESYLGICLLQLIWKTKTYRSIDEFLKMLNELPALNLVSEFLQTGFNQTSPDIHDPSSVAQFIKEKSIPEVEKWKLLYLYSNAEDTKSSFIQLLQEFYEQFLESKLSEFIDMQNKHIQELKIDLQQDTKQKLDRLLSNHYQMLEDDSQIILFPTYFGTTLSTFSHNTTTKIFICTYGIGYAEIVLQQEMNEDRILEAFKVLSDETRVKIIKLLNSTPSYGYELAQSLKLSNSTISHHLSQLTSFGFIHATKEENKNYYQVNKELIQSVMDQMTQFLIQ